MGSVFRAVLEDDEATVLDVFDGPGLHLDILNTLADVDIEISTERFPFGIAGRAEIDSHPSGVRCIHDVVVSKAGRIIVLVFSRDAHHFELVSFCEFGIKHVLSRRSGILRKEIVFRSRPFVEGADEIVFLRFGTLGLFDGYAVDIDDIACVGKAEINNKNTVASFFS